jgi:adenylate cyclase
MPRLTYINERVVETDAPVCILDASLQSGIPHTHACGGNARCSTCRVLVLEGLEYCSPPNDKEAEMAERRHFGATVRLACQTMVNGDVTLRRLVLDDEDEILVDQEVSGTSPRSVGEERTLAILFADVRDFTAFSEAHLPYDVIHVLNRYFTRAGAAINRHGGEINNYMGDGIMALFRGDDVGDATARAVSAGLEMLEGVAAMQPYVETQFRANFRIGVGLHVGTVVLGVVGSADQRRLTAIGDAVNLASRIENATKTAGVPFLMSNDALEHAKGLVRVGRQFSLPIKGKTGEYAVHEVLGRA